MGRYGAILAAEPARCQLGWQSTGSLAGPLQLRYTVPSHTHTASVCIHLRSNRTADRPVGGSALRAPEFDICLKLGSVCRLSLIGGSMETAHAGSPSSFGAPDLTRTVATVYGTVTVAPANAAAARFMRLSPEARWFEAGLMEVEWLRARHVRPAGRRRGSGRRARRGVRTCARSDSSTGDPDLPEPPPPALAGRSQGLCTPTSPARGWSI